MEDKRQKCVEKGCTNEFTITVGEQTFYANKKDENGNAFNPPKRCSDCRAKRKAQREVQQNSPFNEAKEALREKRNDRFSKRR